MSWRRGFLHGEVVVREDKYDEVPVHAMVESTVPTTTDQPSSIRAVHINQQSTQLVPLSPQQRMPKMLSKEFVARLLVLASASSTLALALPSPQTTDEIPTNTTLTYYTGTTSTSDCGYAVASGTLEAGVCNKITTQGLGIGWVESGSCTYTLYTGSQSCDGDDTTVTEIPDGVGQTCIATGVEDGGVHYLGSGIWTCG